MPSEQYKTLNLYCMPFGTPSRHVLLTAKVIGIDLNIIIVDLQKGEHLKREFLQLNPQHKVPVLKDNEFVVAESRAIMTYLTDKYAKNVSLYSKDLQKRAAINQRLFFDADVLLPPIEAYMYPLFTGGKEYDYSQKERIENAMKILDTYLDNSEYLIGDSLTLADLAIFSSVCTAVQIIDFKINPYSNVLKWYNHLKTTLPGYKDAIEINCKQAKALFSQMLNKK